MSILQYRFRLRRRTAASWTSLNEVLLDSEIGIESDTELVSGKRKLKIGDGTTPWNSLPYLAMGSSSAPVGQLAGLNDQTGASYTVAASDSGKDIRCTYATAFTLNIDTQANVPVAANFWALMSQGGAGIATVTAMAGVTLRKPNGAATLAIYDARGIERITGDEWRVW